MCRPTPFPVHFLSSLSDPTLFNVPTVTIYEVFEVILRESTENDALQAIVAMQKGTVVDLDVSLAIAASKLSWNHKLPMADSIALATAKEFGAILWIQDSDSKNIRNVKYFSGK